MSATRTARPAWLTDSRLRRLEELAVNDSDADAEFLLATEGDHWTLETLATQITGNAGQICLTPIGWELVTEFGTIEEKP